jgi:sugar-specific transcriptional regulator TrmB
MPKSDRKPQRSEEPLASPSSLPTGRELEIGLADLGLSEREARLYVAMLSKPDSTSTELHRMANISRKKIYDILVRMVERKLCIERQVGRTKRYTPVDPDTLVGSRAQQRVAAQLSQMKKLQHDLSHLYAARHRSAISLEYLETLRTPQQVKERVAYLMDSCHTELLVFSKLPFTVQSDEEADEATLRSLKRIKDVRSIYEFDVTLLPHWKEYKEYITRWHKAGEKSRFVRKLPTKLFVFDSLYVLLLIQDALGPGQAAPVLFSNRELALAFRTLFESVWDTAIPYEEFMARHDEIVKEDLLRHA